MLKIDENLLDELGLVALSREDKKQLLTQMYETLELRVGMKLAEQMSDAQLDEFESLMNKHDDKAALAWLEANLPNYKQVVARELEVLKGEIRRDANKIIEAVEKGKEQTINESST